MRKRGWLLSVVLALLSVSAPAAELPFVLEALSMARPAADVLAGAADADFVPVSAGQFKPATANSEYWLRVTLPADLPDETLVLAIRRVPIDHITFYRRTGGAATDGWTALQSGTLSERDALPFNVCCFGFELPRLSQPHPQSFYLHVRDSSPTALIVRLQTWREFADRDRLETVTVALVLGTLLAMFAVNALFWLVLRDTDYLHLALFQVCLSIYLAHSADLFYRLPDDLGIGVLGRFPWLIAAGVAACFSASFIQRFINLAAHWPRFSRTMDAVRYLIVGIALLTVLPYDGLSEYVRQGFNAVLLLLAAFSGTAPILAFRHARRPAAFVLTGWLIYVLLVANRTQAAMGLTTLDAFSQYAFQIGSAVLAVILTIGLADRTLELRRQRDQAQFLRDRALKRLDIERTRRALLDDLAKLVKRGEGNVAGAAHRRMLAAIAEVMPLDAAAVLVEGGAEQRTVIADPAASQENFADLATRHSATLHSIGLSRSALVLAPDDVESPDNVELNTAVVPMRRSGEQWGVVLLSRPKWQKFERGEFELVRDFSVLAGKAIAEGEQQAELKQQASFDSLTGALNRGNIETLLEKGFQQALQQRHSFCVLFIDLDYFKRVNDDHGHASGDECLTAVAQRISQTLDAGHALGRYGGEEFLVLLPHTGEPAARQLAERIRTAVSTEAVDVAGRRLQVTVSIGGAARQPGELTPRMLLERADQALYQAKRDGRNRVVWADSAAAQSA